MYTSDAIPTHNQQFASHCSYNLHCHGTLCTVHGNNIIANRRTWNLGHVVRPTRIGARGIPERRNIPCTRLRPRRWWCTISSVRWLLHLCRSVRTHTKMTSSSPTSTSSSSFWRHNCHTLAPVCVCVCAYATKRLASCGRPCSNCTCARPLCVTWVLIYMRAIASMSV